MRCASRSFGLLRKLFVLDALPEKKGREGPSLSPAEATLHDGGAASP